jgi:hypothetical protein
MMTDPATGWFEMREIPNQEAITIANLIEQTWLTRYPWPNQIVFNRGKELWHKKKANNYEKLSGQQYN